MAESMFSEQPGSSIAESFARLGPNSVLSHHLICDTDSLKDMSSAVDGVFYPSRVRPVRTGRAAAGSSKLSATGLGDLTFGLIEFGSDVALSPGPLGFYHVNIPLSGRVETVSGDAQVVADARTGVVFNPGLRTSLPLWEAGAVVACVKIPHASMRQAMENLLGRPASSDVQFDLALSLDHVRSSSWLHTLRFTLTELSAPLSLLRRSPSYEAHIATLIVEGLLLTQNHSHSARLDDSNTRPRAKAVQSAVELIESDPRLTYTLGELARHAGVSARHLQQLFHEEMELSPTAYQRWVKLNHARRDLLSGAPSVIDIAYRWGFGHPGRFARHYYAAFGENPSDTLASR